MTDTHTTKGTIDMIQSRAIIDRMRATGTSKSNKAFNDLK